MNVFKNAMNKKGFCSLEILDDVEREAINQAVGEKLDFSKRVSPKRAYALFSKVIRESGSKRDRFYAHFRLELFFCISKFREMLKKQGIKSELFYHYNKLFDKEFEEFEDEIHKFLPLFCYACRVIRQWTPGEKGIVISNFIGFDKRYNKPKFNSWSGRKREFFKKNYYLFNHSCCCHIHHVEDINDVDMLLVSDEWKMKEFNRKHPEIPCIVSSDAFYVEIETFKPRKGVEKVYDLIYLTSFVKVKRNELLLKALASMEWKPKCLFVVETFCYDTEVEKTVNKLIGEHHLDVEIKTDLSREQVVEEINKSRIAVNLCQGSIDRSVFEVFSVDIPLLYLKDNICGKDIINSQTGLLIEGSLKQIAKGIDELLANRDSYFPRRWILENWGEKLANKKLRDAIKRYGYGSTDNIGYFPCRTKGSCVGTYL